MQNHKVFIVACAAFPKSGKSHSFLAKCASPCGVIRKSGNNVIIFCSPYQRLYVICKLFYSLPCTATHLVSTAEVSSKDAEAFKPVISDSRNSQPRWADWKPFDHLSHADFQRVLQCPLHRLNDSESVCVSVWKKVEWNLNKKAVSLEKPASSSATISACWDVWCKVLFSQRTILSENNVNLSESISIHLLWWKFHSKLYLLI